MSLLADVVEGLVTGAVRALKRKPKPWRHGHSFPYETTQCCYCRTFIPGKLRYTAVACPGPDHQLTAAELGRTK